MQPYHDNSGPPGSRGGAARVAALALLAGLAQSCGAVEDTGTPGDGHWEINIDAVGSRTAAGWEFATPNAEFNYGWNDHLLFMLALPWISVRETGQPTRSGWGKGSAGVKWILVDKTAAPFAVAVYPQYGWNLLLSSALREIIPPGRQLLLPLVAGVDLGWGELSAEVGRNIVERGPDERLLGLRVSGPCAAGVECLAEALRTSSREERQTLVNVGVEWKLNQTVLWQAHVGRDIGRRSPGRQTMLLRIGLQILL